MTIASLKDVFSRVVLLSHREQLNSATALRRMPVPAAEPEKPRSVFGSRGGRLHQRLRRLYDSTWEVEKILLQRGKECIVVIDFGS